MIEPFDYAGSPARIVFGNGGIARVGTLIDDLGCRRALVLSTPGRKADAEDLAATLGGRYAGVFAGAVMHTPVEVTEGAVETARKSGADCLVALGGGSTVGLGKAIAWRTGLPQIAIPTTYAGSEVTPILGQTENGEKTTLTDPKLLPKIVVYDPELTTGLPADVSVVSGLNALAHAAEALYARDRNPVSSLMAAEGARAILRALPAIRAAPSDPSARGDTLYGAYLCGTVLGSVGMALHHKLCHTLGGAFGLPHAETHAILLPHTIAYNAAAVPDLLSPLADALDSDDVGQGLYAFAESVGAPRALEDIGMPEDGLVRAADLAVANPYWNPRKIERRAICDLLEDAFRGDAPPPRSSG